MCTLVIVPAFDPGVEVFHFTPSQADDLYELITERTTGSIVITSNRKPEDWYSLFPNPVVAESILDRLINNAHQIPMTGRSYRPKKRPTTTTPTTID